MEKISAVVFDMDGVIFDTERICLEAWKVLAERKGLEGIEDVCIRCIGSTTQETIRILNEVYGDRLDVEALHEEIRPLIFELIEKNGLPIKMGAKQILQALNERDIPIALASSTRYKTVCSQLEQAGFLKYFSVVVGGDMAKESKPAPDIYLEACRQLNILPQKAVAIEDSFKGIQSAHSAGMTTIMVPDILQPDEERLKIVDFKCDNLIQAMDVVLSLT